jgi:hypothetical protein
MGDAGIEPAPADYLSVGSNLGQGVVKFLTSQITASITQASLSVNPYGMLSRCYQIAVYDYQSTTGR